MAPPTSGQTTTRARTSRRTWRGLRAGRHDRRTRVRARDD
jgi:hypothetical protein